MQEEKICSLLAEMTTEEKARLSVGNDFWYSGSVERLGIRGFTMSDGPNGIRKQEEQADHLGLLDSKQTVCFPAGCALAAGFDPELAEQMGEELGKNAAAEGVGVVLGPSMNIKRSPLCGRNFEYFSEDPKLAGAVAAGMIKGIQSQRVGACPKHFLANNQEYYRYTSNSVIDERALREIYLAAFEEAVKEGKPWCIMGAYNRVNGVYACENREYLTDILRKEWGFDGMTVTDWGACDDPVEGIKAGMNLVMPGPAAETVRRIRKGAETGALPPEVLDASVKRILETAQKCAAGKPEKVPYDMEQGHRKAREIAGECAVLLKNEDGILPLTGKEKLLVIGPYAKTPRFQGGGSAHIAPYKIYGAWDELSALPGCRFVPGYGDAEKEKELLEEAVSAAREAEKVILFAGLPEEQETEGIDRRHLFLPELQNRLIDAVAEVQENVIVVLHNGSPVTMPWLGRVKAVLEMFLAGEAAGEAEADLLLGRVNPSGRLPETFPLRIEDTPAYPWYGVEREDVPYRESFLVGYRYYETLRRPVLFPFGYGLSYTKFTCEGLRLQKKEMSASDTLEVCVTVANTGERAGKEVVQLYVSARTKDIVRPERELRAFAKIFLRPGEKKQVSFTLGRRDFSYWKEREHAFCVPDGEYRIQVCADASTVLLQETVRIREDAARVSDFTVNTPLGDLLEIPEADEILAEKLPLREGIGGFQLPREAPLRSLLPMLPALDICTMEELVRRINEKCRERGKRTEAEKEDRR